MGYTLDEIKDLREAAETAQLENRELLWKYRNYQLQSLCNGIGPASFPAWARALVSDLNPTLEPAAAIHDLEWHESTGTYDTFVETNRRLARNGKRLACVRYAWYDPRRTIVIRQARRFARLCTAFGWSAYAQARSAARN